MPEVFRLSVFDGLPRNATPHAPFVLDPVREHGNEYTAVIGPNGTGKSALLGSIAKAAQSEKLRTLPSRTVAIANLVTDAFPLNRVPASNAYQYLGLRQGSNTVTTGALTAASAAALLSLPLSSASDLPWRDLCEQLQMEAPRLVATQSRTPRRPEKTPTSLRDQVLRDAENRLADAFADLDPLLVDHAYGRDVWTLDVQPTTERFAHVLRGLEYDLDAATLLRRMPYATGWRLQLEYERKPSAGQEVMFSQLLRVASASRPGALVLIDEPETGLHPQWQANVIPMMRDVVPEHLGMHLLLATHSPYLVGEADSVVAAGADGFTQIAADLGGLSVDTLMYKVFGASTSGSVLVERDVAVLLEFLSDGTSSNRPSPKVQRAAIRLRARETTDTEVLSAALAEYDQATGLRRPRGKK